MDAFFASVEQRDNPALRGQPVAVGGSAERGVVAAASYEARQFGVRSAMPSVSAKRRCPQLIFVKPRFDVYKAVSRQIRAIFARYSGLVEPLSLDEAYLDVTEDRLGIGSAIRVAASIRRDILAETGLTASAGISYNKFLAKVASDQNKPNGQFVVLPEDGAAFVAALPARRFYGVGPRTAERMAQLGIHTGADLRAQSLGFLQQHFGKSALYLYHASRGEDDRPVRPDRVRKSVGGERTYARDLQSSAELHAALDEIIDIVWQRVAQQGVQGRTLTLKMKYADFRQVTRARSLPAPILERQQFDEVARSILGCLLPVPLGVRLLGLSLSGFEPPSGSLAPRVAEPAPAQYPLQF
ncbi:MAG: DNA polymerase IV [Haliea sp.]|nr:DNA polymerase IV [Haliea sp.]|tara:strand:- start:31891 stop:32955 length:1065 start_codon:yes stop_codon:yes gene_type:complete